MLVYLPEQECLETFSHISLAIFSLCLMRCLVSNKVKNTDILSYSNFIIYIINMFSRTDKKVKDNATSDHYSATRLNVSTRQTFSQVSQSERGIQLTCMPPRKAEHDGMYFCRFVFITGV